MTYSQHIVLDPEGQHTAEITCLAFSPMGTHLATGDKGGTVVIWDVKTGRKVSVLTHTLKPEIGIEVASMLWDPSRLRTLFIGRIEGVGEGLPDALDPKSSLIVNTGTSDRMSCMDYDARTRSLAVIAGQAVLMCRPMGLSGDYVPIARLPKPRPPILSDLDSECDNVRPRDVRVNRGATMVYVTYLEHGIVCWDAVEETALWQLFTEPSVISHASFLKDYRQVFVALGNGQAALYRISERRPQLSLQFHEGPSFESPRTAVLLRGRAVAVGARNAPVRIWTLKGEISQQISADSARGQLTGVYAGCDSGSTGNLACVAQEGESIEGQRIIMLVTPLGRSSVAEMSADVYMLYVRDIVEKSATFIRTYFFRLSFALLLLSAAVIISQPEMWAIVGPTLYEWLLVGMGVFSKSKEAISTGSGVALEYTGLKLHDFAEWLLKHSPPRTMTVPAVPDSIHDQPDAATTVLARLRL